MSRFIIHHSGDVINVNIDRREIGFGITDLSDHESRVSCMKLRDRGAVGDKEHIVKE